MNQPKDSVPLLHLEKVTGKNVWDLLNLRVRPDQSDFVADNAVSLAEAYASSVDGGSAFPFGIYEENVPVGFLMIGFGVRQEEWPGAPKVNMGNYSLWRLMIDARYQGRGYGRQAVQLALDFVKSFPCGPAAYCWVSYEPENTVSAKLYHAFGFQENGEKDGDEIVAVLKL